MKLIAEIKDPQLLLSLTHRKGSTFYMVKDELWEIIYYSGNKIVHFVGNLDEEQARLIRALGTECEAVQFDPFQDLCMILQMYDPTEVRKNGEPGKLESLSLHHGLPPDDGDFLG